MSSNNFFFFPHNRFETPRGGNEKRGRKRGSERKGKRRVVTKAWSWGKENRLLYLTWSSCNCDSRKDRSFPSFLPSSSHYYASRGKNFLHARDSRIIEFTDSGVENSILKTSIFKGAFIHPLSNVFWIEDPFWIVSRILKGYQRGLMRRREGMISLGIAMELVRKGYLRKAWISWKG